MVCAGGVTSVVAGINVFEFCAYFICNFWSILEVFKISQFSWSVNLKPFLNRNLLINIWQIHPNCQSRNNRWFKTQPIDGHFIFGLEFYRFFDMYKLFWKLSMHLNVIINKIRYVKKWRQRSAYSIIDVICQHPGWIIRNRQLGLKFVP